MQFAKTLLIFCTMLSLRGNSFWQVYWVYIEKHFSTLYSTILSRSWLQDVFAVSLSVQGWSPFSCTFWNISNLVTVQLDRQVSVESFVTFTVDTKVERLIFVCSQSAISVLDWNGRRNRKSNCGHYFNIWYEDMKWVPVITKPTDPIFSLRAKKTLTDVNLAL